MTYLEVTEAAGRAFFSQPVAGPVVMLNLLQFRDVADYSSARHLSPPLPISGRMAYELYIAHTQPFLARSGGRVLFRGRGGPWLIGPEGEGWDEALLIEQSSTAAFLAFASDPDYLAGIGHRTAALRDSRLLPLIPS